MRRIIPQLSSVQNLKLFTRCHNFFSGEKILRRILLSVRLYASGSGMPECLFHRKKTKSQRFSNPVCGEFFLRYRSAVKAKSCGKTDKLGGIGQLGIFSHFFTLFSFISPFFSSTATFSWFPYVNIQPKFSIFWRKKNVFNKLSGY